MTSGQPGWPQILLALAIASPPLEWDDPLMMSTGTEIPHSIGLKLNRATEHIDVLADEVRAYVTEQLAVRRTVEAGGTEHALVWERYSTPPERLGLIMGDAVHNIRTALDHLVFLMAEEEAGKTASALTPAEEKGLQFPIYENASTFDSNVARNLPRLTDRAVDYIRGRQPFNVRGDGTSIYWLSRLSALDNADKHRKIIPALELGKIVTSVLPDGLTYENISKSTASGIQPGVDYCRFKFSKAYGPGELELRPWFDVGIVADLPHSAEFILRGFVQAARSMAEDLVAGAYIVGPLIVPAE